MLSALRAADFPQRAVGRERFRKLRSSLIADLIVPKLKLR